MNVMERTTAGEATQRAATARLAHFVATAAPTGRARELATASIVDTMAVMLAGGTEPEVQRLGAALPRAPDGWPGAVPAIWSPGRLMADDAAKLYGMASHILDYDDVSMQAVCHPTVPVLTACLAARPDGMTGAALIDAVCVGTEVMIRLGEALGFRHYELGFHATGTLGTLGAAAGVARLLGLAEATTVAALSIAASSASGIRRNFGTPIKSLHVGLAAEAGLRAVRWADAGLAGAAEPLEASGFLFAYSGGETDAWPAEITLGDPYVIASPGFELKRYPCCYMLHKMIHATLELQARGIGLDDVASARIETAPGGTRALVHPNPTTALEALFSGPYAIAACLADGRIDLASFTQEAVDRPRLRARFGDIVLAEREGRLGQGGEVGKAPVTVTLRLRDGTEVSATCTANPGSPDDPIPPAAHLEKWRDCLTRFAPGADAAAIAATFEAGMALDTMGPVAPWLDRLATIGHPK
ncbi:MmgE/PrpD family protein [Acuticoccus sp. I52.16.1]|uniref:MmgE/PrpD family protein n=1 Tax=Acuticoccus sp. I52.16.1 TaxID=2928472 RepID=UPI001FD39263|nr:MmgE/PrpD family protein [Acuticoccus sp. I52.16.1]UOM33311.1 MmgE/PrpD family protein [Acuticoccus sp. I52.16.1]